MSRPLIHQKITFKCLQCGKEKTLYYNPNQKYKFCSNICRYKYKKKLIVEKICRNCGSPFLVDKSIKNRYSFCGNVCKILYSNSANNLRRGGSWEQRRKQALLRDDYKCRLCGHVAEVVHHIVPFRSFQSGKEANKLDNIISLCDKCHKVTYARELEFVDLFNRILKGDKNDR